MKLFFDRDIGTGVPQALKLVDYAEVHWADYVYRHREHRSAHVSDVEWLELAGRSGWLAISENTRMMQQPHERQAIIDHRVGVVLLDAATERAEEVLAFLLRRKSWLGAVSRETRPVVYQTSLRGRARRMPLMA